MAYFAPVTVAPADAQQILSPDILRDLPKELPKKFTGNARIASYEVDPTLNTNIRPVKSPDPKLDERFNRQPGFYGWEIPLDTPGTPEKDARGNPFPKYVAQYDPEGNFQQITTSDKYFVTSGQGDKDTYVIPKIDLSGRLISMGSGTPEQAKKSIFRVLGETALEAAPAYLAALAGANLLNGASLFGGGAGAGAGAAGAASSGTGLSLGSGGVTGLIAGGGSLGLTAASPGAAAIGGSLGTTLAGISTGIGATTAASLSSQVASQGLLGGVVNKVAAFTGLSPTTVAGLGAAGVQALLSSAGANKIADQAQQAAQTQADAQVRAAQIAADAARFRPVGVTTRFGSSNFGFDDKGNLITAGYTPTGEITGYQDRLRTLAGQGLTDVEAARTAYQPLTGAAQSLFTLGQSYLAKSPEQAAQDYITKQQALLAPSQENQLALLQNKLFQQGRTGAASAQGGNLMATNPEMAAYYNSIAQSNLNLAANAEQEARNRIAFGGGLFNTGAGLQNQFYSGQTAAYQPFATAMDTSIGLENLAQQPLTLGTQIGAKTTAATAQAGNLLSQGITNAAKTMAAPNAYSASGNLLTGVANNPMVTSAINNAFGVQSSAPKYQIINGQLVQVS
jgi:hypothetical protein